MTETERVEQAIDVANDAVGHFRSDKRKVDVLE